MHADRVTVIDGSEKEFSNIYLMFGNILTPMNHEQRGNQNEFVFEKHFLAKVGNCILTLGSSYDVRMVLLREKFVTYFVKEA